MASKNAYTGIHPKFVQEIRYNAISLKKKKCFIHETLEDIEQQLFVDCWPQVSKYNELDNNYGAYVSTLVKSRALNLQKKQSCKKRRIDFIDTDEILDQEGESFEHEITMRIDVNETISELPPKLQRICRLLIEHDFNVNEVCKSTGISKSTIYETIEKIGKHKKFASLKTYLSKREL